MIINFWEKESYNDIMEPEYVYIIDKKEPDYVFKNGFFPWGENEDFFAFVAGFNSNYRMSEFYRTRYISVFSSITSACNSFINSYPKNFEFKNSYYIYQIRANEKFYNTAKTLFNFIPRVLNDKSIDEDNRKFIDNTIKLFSQNFLWENSWFTIGNIPTEIIKCAWKIEFFEWNKNLINSPNQKYETYYNMSVSESEIKNFYYKNKSSKGNPKPFKAQLPDIKKYKQIPEIVINKGSGLDISFDPPKLKYLYSEAYWRLNSMLPNITPTPSFQQPGFERESLDLIKINNYEKDFKGFNHCLAPIGVHECSESELSKTKTWYRDYKNLKYSDLVFVNKDMTRVYKYSSAIDRDKFSFLTMSLISDSKSELPLSRSRTIDYHEVYYDVFSRISFLHPNYLLPLSITPIVTPYSEDLEYWRLHYTFQTIDDDKQKWKYLIYKEIKNHDDEVIGMLVRVMPTYNYPDHLSLFIKKKKWEDSDDYPVYLGKTYELSERDDHEEIFLYISKDDTNLTMVHAQLPFECLVELGFEYEVSQKFYTIDMYYSDDWHQKSKMKNKLVYDTKRKRIYWIDSQLNIHALYNFRSEKENWEWTGWKIIDDLDDDLDNPRYKWYFSSPEDTNRDSKQKRYVYSYFQNDWLKVATGSHFGKLYTSIYKDESYSQPVFYINKNIYF